MLGGNGTLWKWPKRKISSVSSFSNLGTVVVKAKEPRLKLFSWWDSALVSKEYFQLLTMSLGCLSHTGLTFFHHFPNINRKQNHQ